MVNVAFQRLDKLNIQRLGHKPTEDEIKRVNHASNWELIDRPSYTLANTIINGDTFRLGIKLDGNRKENFKYATGCCLDIDCKGNQSALQSTIENPFTEASAAFVYPSISYNAKDNWNHRIVFIYDRPVTDWREGKKIILYLMSQYEKDFESKVVNKLLSDSDKQTHDPARLWYGMGHEHRPFYRSDDNLLSVDLILSEIPQWITDYVEREHLDRCLTNSSDEELVTSETLLTQIYHLLNKYIIDKHFDGNFYDLVTHWSDHYNLYTQEWLPKSNLVDNEADSKRGIDPILGGTSGESNSFVLSKMKNDTYLFLSGKTGKTGDLVSLYAYLHSGSWDIDVPVSGQLWRNALRDISELHNEPQLFKDFESLKEEYKKEKKKEIIKGLPSFVLEDAKGNFKVGLEELMIEFFNQYRGRVYYCLEDREYHFYESNHWIRCEYRYIMGIVKGLVEHADKVCNRQDIGSFWSGTLMSNVSKYLRECIPHDILRSPLVHDVSYFPFANGLYDLENKKLIDFTPEVINTFVDRVVYEPVLDDEPREIFSDVYRKVCDNPDDADILLNWVICAIQGKAIKTRLALALVGASRSGKTTIYNIIENILGENQIANETSDEIFGKLSNQFSFNVLRSKYLLFLDDFSGLSRGSPISRFKKLIPGDDNADGVLITADTKGGKHINFKFTGGMLITCENVPYLGGEIDGGLKNRFLWVHVHRVDPNITNLKKQFDYLKTSPKLICWLVQQDANVLVNEFFTTVKEIPSMQKVDKQNILASNPYARFLSECYVYDSTAKGKTADFLYNEFEVWCSRQGEKCYGQHKFGKEIKKVALELWSITKSEFSYKSGNICYRVRPKEIGEDEEIDEQA